MTHRRKEFPASVKRDAYDRATGDDGITRCECHRVWQLPTYRSGCGSILSPGNCFYEHIEPDRLGGLNDLDNCAALSKTCWKLKTAGYDRPKIDKSKRVADLARGIRSRSTMLGSRDSNIKLRINGPPIDRRTGKPWSFTSRFGNGQ